MRNDDFTPLRMQQNNNNNNNNTKNCRVHNVSLWLSLRHWQSLSGEDGGSEIQQLFNYECQYLCHDLLENVAINLQCA